MDKRINFTNDSSSIKQVMTWQNKKFTSVEKELKTTASSPKRLANMRDISKSPEALLRMPPAGKPTETD